MSNFKPFIGIDLVASKSSIDISDFLNLIDYEKGVKKIFFKNSLYQVIWYKNLYDLGEGKKNRRVEVVFASSNGFQISVKLPLDIILKVPIGSVWKNGLMVKELDTGQYVFSLQEAKGKSFHRPNVRYISQFYEKKQEEKQEEEQEKYRANLILREKEYPVRGIDSEANTLIIVEQGELKFIIHPLIFFLTHYGSSKHINNVLVSHPWGDVNNNDHSTVKNLLELDYKNTQCSKAVLIPKSCLVSDAVILHYLREDEYTKRTVKEFNATTRQKLNDNKNKAGGISVKPYHQQSIEMLVKGIPLGGGIILCSEVLGMSLPRGEEIFYDFKNSIQVVGASNTQSFRPMYINIEKETIVVADTRGPNNSTTAVIRQKQKVLGDIRKISRNEGISLDEAFRYETNSIPLREPIPDFFAPGSLVNTAGSVGMLKVFVDSGVEEYTDTNPHKILRYARQLKHYYKSVKIDCYLIEQGYKGEVVKLQESNDDRFPKTIYILRLIIDGKYYFVFDSQPLSILNVSGISGIIVKVISSFDPEDSIYELFNNEGKFHNMDKGNIRIFNHMTKAKKTNWLRNALIRF